MRAVLIAVLCLSAPLHAADLGSPARGETLAREVCAACHGIARGEASPIPEAAGFADVADLVSTTRQSLFVFLNSSHPTMPNLMLTEAESDDIIAYILSLRQD